MSTKARDRIHSDAGFTLIELLVVILIIGILAAVAIPAFLGQRTKAQDGQAKVSVTTAAEAAEAHYSQSENSSPAVTDTIVRGIEPTLNDAPANGSNLTVMGTNTSYIVAVKATSTNTFSIKKDLSTGIASRSCGTGTVNTTTGVVGGSGGNGSCGANNKW